LHQLIRQTVGEDLPIAVTEINTNPGKGVPAQALAAAWWAETLGELMSNQVDYVTFFSTEGLDTPYPLFTQKSLNETAMLRVMQLFAQLQSNGIPTQGGQGLVSIYATQNQEHTTASLLFINKTAESQYMSVRTGNVLPFGPWQRANLTLQGYGLVVLTLHRSSTDEAFSFSNRENAQQGVPEVQHLVCANMMDCTLEY
jgi:hypothetical protein